MDIFFRAYCKSHKGAGGEREMGALEMLWKLRRNTKFLGREREGADEDKGLKI